MQNDKVIQQVIALRDELVKFTNRLVLGTSLSAEDIVQDVTVSVLKSERVFTKNDDVRAYCYRAVRNLFINLNKRETRLVSLNGGSTNAEGKSVGISHDDAISNLLSSPSAEEVALEGISPELQNALSTLHAGIRETFLLVTIQGLTYAECAEFQGISAGTVMSRIARAKKHLKAALLTA